MSLDEETTRILNTLKGVDLSRADGRAGIGRLLAEIERRAPGAMDAVDIDALISAIEAGDEEAIASAMNIDAGEIASIPVAPYFRNFPFASAKVMFD